LFIGVGIHPAISVETKTSIVNQQSENDCGCEEVSNTDLIKVERLLNRLEVHIKLLLVLSKHNPELTEEYEELSNEIITLNGMYKGLKPNSTFSDRPICDLLWDGLNYYFDLYFYYEDLANYSGSFILLIIYSLIASFYCNLALVLMYFFFKLDCYPPHL